MPKAHKKYSNQVIFEFEDDRAYKEQFNGATRAIALATKGLESGLSSEVHNAYGIHFNTPIVKTELSESSRLYLIGHGTHEDPDHMYGGQMIGNSYHQVKIHYQQLAKKIAEVAAINQVKHLNISLVMCHAAVGLESSFAAKFATELKEQYGITANISAATNELHIGMNKGNKKVVLDNQAQGESHLSTGKILFNTEGEHLKIESKYYDPKEKKAIQSHYGLLNTFLHEAPPYLQHQWVKDETNGLFRTEFMSKDEANEFIKTLSEDRPVMHGHVALSEKEGKFQVCLTAAGLYHEIKTQQTYADLFKKMKGSTLDIVIQKVRDFLHLPKELSIPTPLKIFNKLFRVKESSPNPSSFDYTTFQAPNVDSKPLMTPDTQVKTQPNRASRAPSIRFSDNPLQNPSLSKAKALFDQHLEKLYSPNAQAATSINILSNFNSEFKDCVSQLNTAHKTALEAHIQSKFNELKQDHDTPTPPRIR